MWALIIPLMPFVELVDVAVKEGRMPFAHHLAAGLTLCPLMTLVALVVAAMVRDVFRPCRGSLSST